MLKKLLLTLMVLVFNIHAENNETEKLQDMSDPLAVFTQVGFGFSDKGLNFKYGQAYDSGKPNTMAMNIIEVQGAFGDALGYRSDQVNSIDSFRFRNFSINTKNGLGAQLDANWDFNTNVGSVNYALIQGLPKMGIFNFYPLAGLGLTVAENVDDNTTGWAEDSSSSGLSVPGGYFNVGMYSKIGITDKLWLNYNPVYFQSIVGSDTYKDNAYGLDNDELLTHEAVISYQFTPRFNVRYFGNWDDETDYLDGDHRIEFNYQL